MNCAQKFATFQLSYVQNIFQYDSKKENLPIWLSANQIIKSQKPCINKSALI